MEGAAIKYNFGSFSTNIAQLDCSFEISERGNARILLFATDPSKRRKAGILFTLNNHGYEHLKQILQQTTDAIGRLRSSNQLNQMVVSFQEKATIEVKTGSVFSICGQFDFRINIMPDKSGYLIVHTFDPSDLRKSGVTFFLDEYGLGSFKGLTNQIDELLANLLASNQIQHTNFYESGTCLSTHCPDNQSYAFYQELRAEHQPQAERSMPSSSPPVDTPTPMLSQPVANLPVAGHTTPYRLVCPKCEVQNVFELFRTVSSHNLTCQNCHTVFVSNIVRVRSKNSRGNKKYHVRGYSIRVVDASQQEHLIEFETVGYSNNFDLRSRDEAVFTYHQNTLKIVQNLTVGQYMKVSAPSCYLATYVYGQDSFEVALLRQFRDDHLLQHSMSSKFVSLYYWLSPIVISQFGSNCIFRALSNWALSPIILAVKALVK